MTKKFGGKINYPKIFVIIYVNTYCCMIELFEKSGITSLGSRLRWLSDLVTRDASEIYRLYDIDIKPKWFPVLYMLFYGDDSSVTGIAKAIGQTHPSVSNMVKEMSEAGLITYYKDESDRRTTVLYLTDKGRALKNPLKRACAEVESVVRSIDGTSNNKLWEAIGRWEET